MKLMKLYLVFKRRFNTRLRFIASLFLVLIILFLIFLYQSSAFVQYYLTLGGNFSILTPKGFSLGEIYDFNNLLLTNGTFEIAAIDLTNELVLPRPDKKTIIFKYPEAITLGRPTYLGNEITQSVGFTVKEPPATGIMQIWVLSSSIKEFLETSKNYSTINYLTFNSKDEKSNTFPCTIWDYTFVSQGRTIKGLEAFFDDTPYMYRLSVFLDEKDYNKEFQTLFDNMVKSVQIE